MKALIVIGPSGVGKGTIIQSLLLKYPNLFRLVLSYTTRLPRPGQVNGLHYQFITHHQFQTNFRLNQMLEAKIVFGNCYGTCTSSYMDLLNQGFIPILDIDVEGMLQIKAKIQQANHQEENSTNFLKLVQEPQVICILPPSWHILKERLKWRKTECTTVLQNRLIENRGQVQKMLSLKNISFITNYQYQLSVYGVQMFLLKHFPAFRSEFKKSGDYEEKLNN